MEKPTQYSGDNGSIVEPPSRWFRALMGVLASYELKNVLLPSGRLSPDGPVKKESEPARRHVTSLHSHKYPEICVCVRGQAMMELEDGLHEMSSPSIFFALPGTPHCQAATRDDLPHALSWLAYSSEAILCNSSIYTPGEGWEDSHRGSLEGEDVRGLSQVLEELPHAVPAPRSEPGEGEEQGRSRDGSPIPLEMMRIIRAKLINVTNRMYQRAVRSQNNQKEEQRSSLEYHKPVLRYVRAYIDDNLDQRSTLGELGEMARLSPNYLNQLFREWMGEPLHQYAIRRRMERARTLLREGEMLVKQVARRVGYDDPLYFSRAFHDYFGEWPTEVGSDIVF